MSKVAIEFNQYYTYDRLTDYLKQYAEHYPEFCSLEAIGKSHEGRNVWAMTVTNQATGPAEHKPAMYVDGNIHAGEVTGSMACLYLIDFLVGNYDSDQRVKKLLDTRSFYIIPRINPDGAELYLTTPTMLRSSVRPYPDWRQDEDPPGLQPEDVDGDGQILQMRVRDDARGAWKADPEDDRLMLQRKPWDLEGPFYHLFTEGVLRDEQGELQSAALWPFNVASTKYGLDLNRNFPAGYSPLTPGSGPFPLSEPETRNQVEFISKHKNIGGVLLYHTTGGVLFRPHSTMPDKDFPGNDAQMYEVIGKMGTDVTGYPVVCCYGDIWSGVLDDWCYEQLGIFAFTPELWDLVGRAAPELKSKQMQRMTPEERNQLDKAILRWSDRELGGRGFVRWHKYEHPQLGEVEIGGYRMKEFRQNPPRHLLEAECHKINQFAMNYALALPEVAIDEVAVQRVAPGVYDISAVVSNHSYLPTHISQMALKHKAVRPDAVRLELASGMALVNCEAKQEIGHLAGYAAVQNVRWGGGSPAQGSRRVHWTVKIENEAERRVKLRLISQRGGTVVREVELA